MASASCNFWQQMPVWKAGVARECTPGPAAGSDPALERMQGAACIRPPGTHRAGRNLQLRHFGALVRLGVWPQAHVGKLRHELLHCNATTTISEIVLRPS